MYTTSKLPQGRPTGRCGAGAAEISILHHTKYNPTTKIRDFCPFAFSYKAGHNSFMGDNLKK